MVCCNSLNGLNFLDFTPCVCVAWCSARVRVEVLPECSVPEAADGVRGAWRARAALSRFSLLRLLLPCSGPSPVAPALSDSSVWAAYLVLRRFSHFQALLPFALGGRHSTAFQRCAQPSSWSLWVCWVTWRREVKAADGIEVAHQQTLK